MPVPQYHLNQPIWDALRSVRKPATIAELQRSTGARTQTVTRRLRYWTSLGLARELPGRPTRYRISPVHLEQGDAPTGGELSQDVWAALKRLGGEASCAEILAATSGSDRAVYCRLFRWVQSGHLERIPGIAARYSISKEGRAQPEAPIKIPPKSIPRKGATMRSRVWVAMRILKTFDVPLLTMTAEVNRRACEDMISSLARAGYIRTVAHRMRRFRTGHPNGCFARTFSTYQLVRNTGPKAPIIACPQEGGRILIDRNTGESIPLVSRRKPKAPAKGGQTHGR